MSRLTQARQATREQLKARVALDGPSGSGKTWTSLEWASVLAGDDGKPLHIDTEHGSASLYADRFDFDTLRWDPPYDLDELADTIRDAGNQYPVIVVDSWSHFWEGEGGTLDTADAAGQRSGGNSFAGWKVATPKLRHLIDTILASPAHVIVTMRTKTEWVLEPDARGKMVPRRVGTAPVMRQGIEYEFTLVGDLDLEHRLVVTKSRCAPLADAVVQPGRASDAAETFAGWLNSGEAMPSPGEVQDLKDRLNAQPGAVRRTFKERWGHPDRVTADQLPDVVAWLDGLDDDPDPDGPGKTSASAEGEQTTKEASGASDSVADLDERSPAPTEGALGSPTAGEGDEASTATLAEEPAPAEGDIDAATRRRLFALVTECCPAAENLSSEANDEVRKRWLLRLVQALDATAVPLESRSLISERSARKAVLACEEITEGRATYEDFVEGRVRVHVRANGGLTVQRKRGKAA